MQYRDNPSKDSRDRNLANLATINNIDPYDPRANSWRADTALLPPTSSLNITKYLVQGISVYSFEKFFSLSLCEIKKCKRCYPILFPYNIHTEASRSYCPQWNVLSCYNLWSISLTHLIVYQSLIS